MHFTTTFIAVLGVFPALIEAYHPFPVNGLSHGAGAGAGHKMIQRRVGKRGCAVKASASSSTSFSPSTSSSAAAVTSTLVAAEAIASRSVAVSSAAAQSSAVQVASFSSAAAAPAPTGDEGSLPAAVAGPFSGDGTFFTPGLGACGKTNDSGDKIVAVAAALFDQYPGNNGNPNTNPICDRKLLITYKGVTAEATVRDRCPECTIGSLDMTESLFNDFAASSVGRLSDSIGTGSISWVWA